MCLTRVGSLTNQHFSICFFSPFCNKVDLLKNKLTFDEAFNYKEEPDLDAALKRLVVIYVLIRIIKFHFPL